ncbi:MAG: hypothetical protein ACLPX5_13790 [Dissulfurispiraceae bacterium]
MRSYVKIDSMTASPFTEKLKSAKEIVICDSEPGHQAHKELFRFNDDVYMTFSQGSLSSPPLIDDVFTAIMSTVIACIEYPHPSLSKFHMVLRWENLLRISLWQETKPGISDILLLLKSAGVTLQELQPFRKSDINDIFPWLYYGQRFDVLRKICQKAKKQIETRVKNHPLLVSCHIIAEDSKKIVASSL